MKIKTHPVYKKKDIIYQHDQSTFRKALNYNNFESYSWNWTWDIKVSKQRPIFNSETSKNIDLFIIK